MIIKFKISSINLSS